jgi:hypothetical protein
MTLTTDDAGTLKSLANQHEDAAVEYARLDGYYDGIQRLEALGLAVPPQLHRFVTLVNWPRVTVDAVEERLDVEGFRYPGADEADADLWRIWQASDLDEESELAHTDALVYGVSYVCVGTNERDPETPLVSIESPLEMTHAIDPRTREVSSALRAYGPDENGQPQFATLYLPEQTSWLERQDGEWVEYDRDEHRLGDVPVVPIVNRPRTGRRLGVSEMADVISLTDACARALTNAQVAAEAMAVPQRGVLGATKGDFVDANGEPLTTWQAYFGAVWALGNENAKTFQFDAADLKNFETIVHLYARLVSSVTGLPPVHFGFGTTNPPSADAIRSSESRLVKKCERKQRQWSGAWEEVMRLAHRFQNGGAASDPRFDALETLWRDPATPTEAQRADAVVKLHQAGILPTEAAWEEMGYSAARIARLKNMRTEQTDSDLLGTLADQFRQT